MTHRDWVEILLPWIPVVGFALFFPYIRSLRARAVNQAGELLLRVLRPRVRRWSVCVLALYCVVLVMQWSFLLTATVQPRELARAVAYTILPLFALLHHRMGLGGMYIEFRQNGVVFGCDFRPWGKIQSYTWLDSGPNLRLRFAEYGIADYRIAASQKDALDQLRQEKVPAANKTEQSISSSGAGSCV